MLGIQGTKLPTACSYQCHTFVLDRKRTGAYTLESKFHCPLSIYDWSEKVIRVHTSGNSHSVFIPMNVRKGYWTL